MLCTCSSRKKTLNYQKIPTTGCNYSLNKLRLRLNSADLSAPIYYYIMTSIQNGDNTLQHIGSGPNWQGGIITLCTCKHFMRTFSGIEKGTWIAGFSNISAGHGENFLIYFMRIGQTFESHYDLWDYLPEEVRKAKAADVNPFGDIYRPSGRETQQFPNDPSKYHKPCRGHSHSHCHQWHKDIKYTAKKGIDPLLLVGDAKYSFAWDQCMITFKGSIGRGQRKFKLCEFLDRLHEANQKKQ